MPVGLQLLFGDKYRLDRVRVTTRVSLVSVRGKDRCLQCPGSLHNLNTHRNARGLHPVCSMDQLIYRNCYVKPEVDLLDYY